MVVCSHFHFWGVYFCRFVELEQGLGTDFMSALAHAVRCQTFFVLIWGSSIHFDLQIGPSLDLPSSIQERGWEIIERISLFFSGPAPLRLAWIKHRHGLIEFLVFSNYYILVVNHHFFLLMGRSRLSPVLVEREAVYRLHQVFTHRLPVYQFLLPF